MSVRNPADEGGVWSSAMTVALVILAALAIVVAVGAVLLVVGVIGWQLVGWAVGTW